MEQWKDQGIVLSLRHHGENGAVLSVLTENHGRYSGYVRGVHSPKARGILEQGNLLDLSWSSRVADGLGFFSFELVKSYGARFMSDPLRLSALQAACAISEGALPEREQHGAVFHGVIALFEALDQDLVWGAAYVVWEVALLKELGFSLDLTRCAGGGDALDLAYVSPKTGRAVSRFMGDAYKDKLLVLPGFLRPGGDYREQDILDGVKLTEYFLSHWVFCHDKKGTPEARLLLRKRLESKGVQ